MGAFGRRLLIAVFGAWIGLTLLVGAATRIIRPVYPPLDGRLTFLLGENCDGARCPFRIGVVHGESYRPMPLPVEPLAFAWSPDGARLALIGRDSATQNAALYVARADGTQLTPLAPLNFLDAFAWSPDGQHLTYSYTLEGDSGIYRIAVDAAWADSIRLTNGLVSMTPIWSPDGAWIMFQARGYQGQEIYLVNPETGGVRNLTVDAAYDYAARWSPDGEQILFLSRERSRAASPMGVPFTQAFIMDRHGREPRQITQIYGNVFGAEWSPSGDMLAFYVAEASTDLPFWGNLYVLDISHQIMMPITRSTITNNIGDFAWSPDGTRLAYVLSPLEYSRICAQEIGGRAECISGDRVRKSDLRWIAGMPLPEFPLPTPTPIDDRAPLPSSRLDKRGNTRWDARSPVP